MYSFGEDWIAIAIWIPLNLYYEFVHCLTGSVWVYAIYPPNYNSTVVGEPYCNKTLYLFAFWTTTLVCILFAILIVGGCCCLVCMCVPKSEDQPEQVTPAWLLCYKEKAVPCLKTLSFTFSYMTTDS